MVASSVIRQWWAGYECDTSRYTRVLFPGDGRNWSLWVADRSAPVWAAVAQIMASEPYLFLESAGGTYNCRPPSLHAYALALDLNPKQNPMRPPPLVYDYPETFITRMEGIQANGKPALYWGGRWPATNPPDTMHWQINVSPDDCVGVTWDTGGSGMTWAKPGDPVETMTDADRVFEYQGSFAPGRGQASYDPGDFQEANDRSWIVAARMADQFMQMDMRLRNGDL